MGTRALWVEVILQVVPQLTIRLDHNDVKPAGPSSPRRENDNKHGLFMRRISGARRSDP